jgi:predicted O-methyltransferase YrrM
MLSKLIRPVNILEIGTYTGYSALCLVKEWKNGSLHTIDIKEELVDFQSILTNHLGKIFQHLGKLLQ